jgi:hypothetical protein
MASDPLDPFVRFAADHGIQMSMADLVSAPRDVLAPPDELEWHTLVSVSAVRENTAPVRVVFITDASEHRSPSPRDVLWWLSSDCWTIERSGREFRRWAATHQYAEDDPVALQSFRLHVAQADAVSTLLGKEAYNALLALYESEVSATVEHARPAV